METIVKSDGRLSVSVAGLTIKIEGMGREIVVEMPDYRTRQEMLDNINKILAEYGIAPESGTTPHKQEN